MKNKICEIVDKLDKFTIRNIVCYCDLLDFELLLSLRNMRTKMKKKSKLNDHYRSISATIKSKRTEEADRNQENEQKRKRNEQEKEEAERK